MGDISIVNPTTKDIPNQFYYIDLESVTGGVLSKLIIVNKSEAPSRAQRVVETGDVLFQTVRPYQQNNYLVSGEFELPVVASTGYAQIRTEENQRFLYSLLHTKSFLNEVLLRCTGSSYPAINSNDLKEISTFIPERKEQKRIAELMQLLEERIAKQRQLVEALKSYKRGALSKLFPKKGETTPEYRFAGFTEPWKRRKALELAEYSKGNGYSKGDLTEKGTPIILYGRLYTKYQFAIDEVDTFAIPKTGSVYSQGNEVIVPASGETAEDIARASAVEESGVLLGGDLNILRPFDFINSLFLALAISNGEPQKELAKKAQGKSVVHIHNSDIQEITISYPLREEQDRIVAFFRFLEQLVALHQRKLNEYENIKAGLLQQLFV